MEQWKKQIRMLPKKDLLRVCDAIRKLLDRDHNNLDRKKLVGYDDIYRVRIGKYRIIYQDDGETIIIKAVTKRDESTYKNF